MEIVQNKTKKITAIAILMIMLFSIITPAFAATGEIKLEKSVMLVNAGSTNKINVKKNTTGEELYWSGQNEILGNFVGNSSYLEFKALNEGEQEITVATKDGEVKATCKVIVAKEDAIIEQPKDSIIVRIITDLLSKIIKLHMEIIQNIIPIFM